MRALSFSTFGILRRLVLVASVLAASIASADPISIELPGLVGRYEAPGDQRADDFDFGFGLTSVSSVSIELEIGDAAGIVCTASIPPHCNTGTRLAVTITPVGEPPAPDDDQAVIVLFPGGRISLSLSYLLPDLLDEPFLLEGAGRVTLTLLDGDGWGPGSLERVVLHLGADAELVTVDPPRRPEHLLVVSFDDRLIDEAHARSIRSADLRVYTSGLVTISDDHSLTFSTLGAAPDPGLFVCDPTVTIRDPGLLQPLDSVLAIEICLTPPFRPVLDQLRSTFIPPEEVQLLIEELAAAGARRARGVPIDPACTVSGFTPLRTLTLIDAGQRGPHWMRRGRRRSAFDARAHTFTWSCLRGERTARIEEILKAFQLDLFSRQDPGELDPGRGWGSVSVANPRGMPLI